MLGINRISTSTIITYGQTTATTSAAAKDFYRVLLAVFGVSVGGGLLLSGIALMLSESVVALIIAGAGYLALYVLIYAFQSTYFAAVFNNVHIKGNRLQTDVTITGLFAIVLRTPFLPSCWGLLPGGQRSGSALYAGAFWAETVDSDGFVAAQRDQENALGRDW